MQDPIINGTFKMSVEQDMLTANAQAMMQSVGSSEQADLASRDDDLSISEIEDIDIG